MPLPTQSDVHVSRPLTNVSTAMIQEERNFIAAEVFPNVPVAKQADAIWDYDHGYWNRDQMKKRAAGTESEGAGYKLSATATYFAHVWALHKDIPDQVRANADPGINLDNEATRFVTTGALVTREQTFVDNFFKTGVWTTDITGVSGSPTAGQVKQWNDAASTPVKDVWAGKAKILEATGFEPTVLVLGYNVYKDLVNHADFVDRVKYGQAGVGGPAMVDVSELAQVFKVEKVVIMRSIKNTAIEGATNSHSFIGGKKALLCYAPPAPGLMTPSGGYIYSWTGYLGAGLAGNRIKRFRMEHLASDRVEIEMAFDMKKMAADLGYFFDTIVA